MSLSTSRVIQGYFAPLRASSVALLTTFRRNGAGVATPVGIRVRLERAYFTTWTTTGKVKRLANNPQVTLSPCTRVGQPLGPTVEGVARRLDADEVARVEAQFKPSLWGRMWSVIYRLQRREAIIYEVAPSVAHVSK